MVRCASEPNRGRRARRWRLLFVAAGLALLGVGLASASADVSPANFGTIGLDAKSYGSVVSMSTRSARLYQEADEFVVHRDVVQRDTSSGAHQRE